MVVMAQNIDELPMLARLVVALGLDWFKVEECYPVNLFSAESLMTPRAQGTPGERRAAGRVAQARALVERGGLVFVDHLGGCLDPNSPAYQEFRLSDDFANRTTFHPNRAAWEIACVNPDGTVHLGDYHTPPIGSLMQETFFSLWNGPQAQARRRQDLSIQGQSEIHLRKSPLHGDGMAG